MTKNIPMELETVNKLFLELSQFATATPHRQIVLRAALDNANGLCRSMHAIVSRNQKDTNWKAFKKQLKEGLSIQHKAMYPERYDAKGAAIPFDKPSRETA